MPSSEIGRNIDDLLERFVLGEDHLRDTGSLSAPVVQVRIGHDGETYRRMPRTLLGVYVGD